MGKHWVMYVLATRSAAGKRWVGEAYHCLVEKREDHADLVAAAVEGAVDSAMRLPLKPWEGTLTISVRLNTVSDALYSQVVAKGLDLTPNNPDLVTWNERSRVRRARKGDPYA